MATRQLWVVESQHLPDTKEWHPLLFDVTYTEQHAETLARRHERKYPKEPCRVVRYSPESNSAVNSHDDLVEALQKIAAMTCGCYSNTQEGWHADRCFVKIARAALAKAKGE